MHWKVPLIEECKALIRSIHAKETWNMNAFIVKHGTLLRLYSIAGRIIGWTLLVGGIIWFMQAVAGPLAIGGSNISLLQAIIDSFAFDFYLPGLIALGLSQFIRYMIEPEGRPGLLLRAGDKVLYGFAFLTVIGALYEYGFNTEVLYSDLVAESERARLWFLEVMVVPTIGKVMILVGLGIILRKLLPVIEESKTLV
jgi:hypothetical protein